MGARTRLLSPLADPRAWAPDSGLPSGGATDDDLDIESPVRPSIPAGDQFAGLASQVEAYEREWRREAKRLRDEARNRRIKLRQLEQQLATQQERVAPEGAVILTGDDATTYTAYQALGKPDELKTRLGERDQFQGELTTLKRDALLRDVAQAAGFKPSVLKALGADREYEFRELEIDGKSVKQPFVKDGEEFKPLATYAEQQWADFLPALRATTGTEKTQPGAGVPWPPQPSSTQTQTSNDLVGTYLAHQYSVPGAKVS